MILIINAKDDINESEYDYSRFFTIRMRLISDDYGWDYLNGIILYCISFCWNIVLVAQKHSANKFTKTVG